ncbi:MAG: magnesium transporter CorA family protein [Patescibacteria group bacterium]|jgi:magnesium transporter
MPIEEIRAKNLRWVNITNVKSMRGPEINFLKKNFNFHPINLEDCKAEGQRPKIDIHRGHFFLVMLYPVYNRDSGEIVSREIDFFVGKDYIVTVHDNRMPVIVQLYNHLKKQKNSREKNEFLSNNVILVLYEMLNKLISHSFPMLDHISKDLHRAENNIFQGREKQLVEQILSSRRNIVNYRKSMSAHKNILKKLSQANRAIKLFEPSTADVYFNSLIDKAKDIWDTLESFKESIEALHDTNESLISFRLNQIMKYFTTISVVIFALTLIATIFSIKAPGTPFLNWPLGFWLIILVETIIASLTLYYFKKKRWME